ncbi:MAG TPA: S41 family peptidase [Anaerohalosphaeraceae bacterium]|nr:S41 family peptidase [Anaerohalosphaeraceae bacterium]HOL87886.1 S41 family peptidase [Anaerohalosphaeraceae bacterium]HPP55241.1 S41 family peptidase [Anaerohalosphaeraceae bacterium]
MQSKKRLVSIYHALLPAAVLISFAAAGTANDCNCPSRRAAEPFSLQQAERTLLLGYVDKGDFDTALLLLERSVRREDDFRRNLHTLLTRYKTFQEEWRRQNQQAAEKLHQRIEQLRSDPNQVSAKPEEILSLLIQSRKDHSDERKFLSEPFVSSLTEQIRRNIRRWQSQGEYEKAWRAGLWVLLAADPNNPALQQEKTDLLSKIAVEKKLTAPLCPGQSDPYASVQAEIFFEALRRLDQKYFIPLNYSALNRRALACARHIGEVLACGRKDFLYSADPNTLAAWNQRLKNLQESADSSPQTQSDLPAFLEQIRILLDLNRSTLRLPEGLLVQLLAEAVLEELDPYTEIVWPARSEEFDKQMSGEFAGVGIRIARQDNQLTIIEIIPDSPAEESGQLQVGDSILAIDGTSTENLTLDCAVRLISGPADTPVTLTLRRHEEEQTVTLLRRKIVLPSLHGNTSPLEQPLKTNGGLSAYQIDADPHIAYIRLSGFRKDTAQTLRQILEKLHANGLRGLLLDLRSNSGGLLDAAVGVADLFLETGVIVRTCTREGIEQEITAAAGALQLDIPMAVLVDDGTASGAEILAGALAAPHAPRAVLVGTRTYGKGTVQEVEPLPNGCRLKYTRGIYQLSDGREVPNRYQRLKQNRTDWGLLPDVIVETGEPQLEKARQARRNLEKFFRESQDKSPQQIQQDLLPLLEALVSSDPPLAAGLTILKAKILASEHPLPSSADPNVPAPAAAADPNL